VLVVVVVVVVVGPLVVSSLLLRPYCDERVSVCVCAFVCPESYLRNYTSDVHQIFLCVIPMAVVGSVLLWRRSDTSRISGFMDDVIFAKAV